MGVRVYNLAKELEIKSKELITKLKALNIDVKNHMSSIDKEIAELVKAEILGHQTKPKDRVSDKKTKTAKKEQVAKEKVAVKVREVSPQAQKKEDTMTISDEKPKEKKQPKIIEVNFPITIKDLSSKMSLKANDMIKILMSKGMLVTITQRLSEKDAKIIAEMFDYKLKVVLSEEEVVMAMHEEEEDPSAMVLRPPVVTMMGHVDHGKTSLLDAIREADVTSGEAGGITQHIGAYEVNLGKGPVTFLDTPGHEAFTAMRARGANATDVVVLVVAADDGVMPQTLEAIDHARAAGVPIVVAVNKCDLPGANIEKVYKQLNENNLMPEEWGGKTITVPVSAKTKQGLDNLVEMLLLEAELLELKANPNKLASGIIIEAELSKAMGPVATVLVKNGTLRVNDIVISGQFYGKIKAMINDKGERINTAGPSHAVEILGLNGVPEVGERFYVINNEKKAKEISTAKRESIRSKQLESKIVVTLEGLYEQIKQGQIKDFNIIIKTDVQGSLEVLVDSLLKMNNEEIKINIIHKGTGEVNYSDIMLAIVSNAIIIGFHVGIEVKASELAAKEKVDIRLYSIIYKVIEDIRAAMEGLLEPDIKEVEIGIAEVRAVFKVSKIGVIAGCFVNSGKFQRSVMCKVIRGDKEIYRGKVTSLKRFKDDVKEVLKGFECGIAIDNFKDINEGDVLKAFVIEKTARKL